MATLRTLAEQVAATCDAARGAIEAAYQAGLREGRDLGYAAGMAAADRMYEAAATMGGRRDD